MRYALIGDVDADRIHLAGTLAHTVEDVAHHRSHVRAETAGTLDVGRWVVLEEDTPLAIHGEGMVGGEADRFGRLQ